MSKPASGKSRLRGPGAARSRGDRLKVLHVIGGLGVGGAEALLYRLALRQGGIEHEVACFGRPDWYSKRLEQQGVKVHHLGSRSLRIVPSALYRLQRLVRESRPDVVQTWMYTANVLAGPLAAISRIPVVWSIHHSALETIRLPSRLLVYLGGALARWIPSAVVNCSNASSKIHARIGYDSAPGAIIHNGYDPEEFYPDQESREAMRRSLGVRDDVFLIGSIGRWHPAKHIPNLLRAMAMLRDREVPLHCLLVGNGLDAENSELVAQIDAIRVTDLVDTLGRRADVPELARAMDLHVLPSGDEAFPNVVAETMLSGTPNVSTDVGDAAMMVGDTGWIVPPGDPAKLADAIEQAWREWSEKPKQWEQRRSAARRRIADNFGFEKMAKAYEAVWRKYARPGG